MLRNSCKFLSLALAASLTVAPISAIGWNSNSTRLGLVGLAVIGYFVYKSFFSKPIVSLEEKQRVHNILANDFINPSDNKFVNKIVARIGDADLRIYVKLLSNTRKKFIQARANNNSDPLVPNNPNNKKLLQIKLADRAKVKSLENEFTSLVNLIKDKLGI